MNRLGWCVFTVGVMLGTTGVVKIIAARHVSDLRDVVVRGNVLGAGESGTSKRITIEVANPFQEPVQLIAVTTPCSTCGLKCVNYPATIEPYSEATFEFEIVFPDEVGPFSKSAVLLADWPGLSLPIEISGSSLALTGRLKPVHRSSQGSPAMEVRPVHRASQGSPAMEVRPVLPHSW